MVSFDLSNRLEGLHAGLVLQESLRDGEVMRVPRVENRGEYQVAEANPDGDAASDELLFDPREDSTGPCGNPTR